MKNTITVSVQFDFKGESYKPTATIDLDQLMAQYGELPDFHQWLGTVSGIDPYSYQFEVLESCELEFSEPGGIAAAFLQDGRFDARGFQRQWHEQRQLRHLQEIARRHLKVEDLEQQPQLKAALLEAYQLGCAQG